MASSTISTIASLGGKLVLDLSASAGDQDVNTNVTSASSGKIYLVDIDNPNSSGLYVKIRDNAGATPSTSTTNGAGTPHMMLYCPAQSRISYSIPGGFSYSAGVSFWASTIPDVGSNSSPSSACVVKLVCS
tara:strand:- start:1987 stop:2379 length:393 start_codon:yes stop_codon:yes gene_type:complete